MSHTVVLFVATRQFVFLDATFQIIVHPRSHYQSVLRTTFAVHRQRVTVRDSLGIHVVPLLLVLYQPAFVLEQPKLLRRFLIYARIVFVSHGLEVDLRLDDMV